MSRKGRTYRRVVTSFWTDPDLRRRGLSRDQRHFLLYLFTGPHTNIAGLYWLPLGYAAQETEFSVDVIAEWLRGPLTPYATYDFETEEVFVHKLAYHNIGDELKEKDNRVGAIARALADVHSKPLLEAFRRTYGGWPLPWGEIVPPEALTADAPKPLPQGATPRGLEAPTPRGFDSGPESTSTESESTTYDDHPQGAGEAIAVSVTGTQQDRRPSKDYDGAAGGARPSSDADPPDDLSVMLDEFPEAGVVLRGMRHPGGYEATAATLRSRMLYADEESALIPEPCVHGLGPEERRRIVAAALVEYRDQGSDEWNPRHFAGFVRRLRKNGNAGSGQHWAMDL